MIDELFFQVATLYGKRKAGHAIDKVAIKYLGEELSGIVDKHTKVMTAAGVVGAIPGVGGGIAATAVIASTWKMYYDINKSLGISFSESFLKNVARGVISNLASNGVVVGAANAISFIPGIGTVAAAVGMAAANRAAIKLAAKLYLEMLKKAGENGDINEGSINSLLGSNAGQKTNYGKLDYGNGDIYEGEYNSISQRNGKGTYFWKDGQKLTGTWCEDSPVHGTYWLPDGERYEGDFNEKYQRHGKGTIYYNNGIIREGTWKNHKPVNGTVYFSDGDRYVGDFNEDGAMHGKGTYYSNDGIVREGTWINDRFINGTCYFPEGIRYEGEFNEEGKPHGKGTIYSIDGSKFSGTWNNSIRVNITAYYSNGDRYEGGYNDDGERQGKGTYYWKNGEKHTGDWQNDRRHGYGEYYDNNGKLVQKGIWKNDVSIDAQDYCFPPVYLFIDGDNPSVVSPPPIPKQSPSQSESTTGNTELSTQMECSTETPPPITPLLTTTVSNTEASLQPVSSANVSTINQSEDEKSKKTKPATKGTPDDTSPVSDSGERYEGKVNDKGQRHGKGTLYLNNVKKYEGEFKNGKYHGKGTFSWKDGSKLTGTWKDGIPVNGTYYYSNGDKYEGDLNEDYKKHGKGTCYYKTGLKRIGKWEDDTQVNGTCVYSNGDRYEGEFMNGVPHGKGTYYWKDGSKYIGDWQNDKKHGYGELFDSDGRSVQKGQWENDEYYNPNKNFWKFIGWAGAALLIIIPILLFYSPDDSQSIAYTYGNDSYSRKKTKTSEGSGYYDEKSTTMNYTVPEDPSEPEEETYVPSSMAADVLNDILSLGFPELDKVHRYLERNGYSYIAPTINGKYYAKNCDCDIEEEYITLAGVDEEEDVYYKCTPKNVNNQSVFVETDAYRGPDNTDITVWGMDNYNRILEIIQDHGYERVAGENGSISFESEGKPSIYLYRDRDYAGEAYTASISADSY